MCSPKEPTDYYAVATELSATLLLGEILIKWRGSSIYGVSINHSMGCRLNKLIVDADLLSVTQRWDCLNGAQLCWRY